MPMMMGAPLPVSMFNLPLLVSKLGGNDGAEDQRNALGIISHLSFWGSGERVAAVTSAGAIPPLVQLLGSGSAAEVQEKAAQALWGLSRVDAMNAVAIAAAGAISPLVQLLGPGSPAGVREKAAGALETLAKNRENAVTIVAAGAIPALLQLLSRGSSAEATSAAAALWCLSQNDENAAAFAAAGAFPLLRASRAMASFLRLRWFLLAAILAILAALYVKVVHG
ncbi:hypothetical protein FOA52_007289 [Chlamydomonas sp. UWO 241]|nr:hypothetical protein FOA52_007289 [Chlamydomonas sp. UWO 241]